MDELKIVSRVVLDIGRFFHLRERKNRPERDDAPTGAIETINTRA